MPDIPSDLPVLKQRIREFEQRGELFKAYDLALQGLEHFPGAVWLQHRAILCLANAGATQLARAKYREFGLDQRTDTECVTLDGRLLKQEALQSAHDKQLPLLQAAAARYDEAWQRALQEAPQEAYYPGINVATLNLMAGDVLNARQTAGTVLALIAPALADPATSQEERYWLLASAIEAHLILGQIDEARALASEAMQAGRGDFVKLASTARQLQWVLGQQGLDLPGFGAFLPPVVINYTGHMPRQPGSSGRWGAEKEPAMAAAIAEVLDPLPVVAAYGSLAAGSDILFAEALLARGAKLNVLLPFNKEAFIDISVRPSGEQWISRFEACLHHENTMTVRYATEDQYLGDDSLFLYCSQLAMGLTLLCARHLSATVRQLAIWDGKAPRGVAGTAHDIAIWRRKGHPQTVIRCGGTTEESLGEIGQRPTFATGRASRAMLFGDLKGFSKLGDAAMPAFSNVVMGQVGAVFEQCREGLDFINTWGDGIFTVYADAGRAADAALRLQDAMSRVDYAAAGLPDTLSLRLGGHLGPVFEIHDPVLKRRAYMGAHVSRAARIEPITPEGCVYVTESFAAVLALHNAGEYTCEYVGVTETAKNYGAMRMFLLRRVTEVEQGPAGVRFLS